MSIAVPVLFSLSRSTPRFTRAQVPSMWSVRQLWPGDNYALAQAYLSAGLPDDGMNVLAGNLRRDMLLSGIPGQAGAANGGTDFNDCVHPASRALIEGLFGFQPDYPSGLVTIAPQFPSSWSSANLSTPDFTLLFDCPPSSGSPTLSVTLTQGAPVLVVRLPLRSQAVGTITVSATGSASWNWTSAAGFGQSIIIVTITAAPSQLITAATVTIPTASELLPYSPSIHLSATAGQPQPLVLSVPPGSPLVLFNFSDPQVRRCR
jgi:hypothetical protein